MKMLYVDDNLSGHHALYLKNVVNQDNSNYYFLPEKIKLPGTFIQSSSYSIKTFKDYLKWIKRIRSIALENEIDIIHFLSLDPLKKYFGVKFNFGKAKVIATLHHVETSFFKKISYRLLSKKIDMIVVHSDYLRKLLRSFSVRHTECVDYPCFSNSLTDDNSCKSYFGLNTNIPSLGFVGQLRSNKGLFLLLEALKDIMMPFQLLIAGEKVDFDEEKYNSLSSSYSKSVITRFGVLSDDEFSMAIKSLDCLILPYFKSFNGASGPLIEAAYDGKCIIGPSDKNLGWTISSHHLGYTFKTEDSESLRKAIIHFLEDGFSKDNFYDSFQKKLDKQSFNNKYTAIYNSLQSRK